MKRLTTEERMKVMHVLTMSAQKVMRAHSVVRWELVTLLPGCAVVTNHLWGEGPTRRFGRLV